MPLNTKTIGDFRRLFDGLPDDQQVMMIDPATGVALPILDFDPLTVTDRATGKQVLTLDFETDDDNYFGFDGDKSEFIDSNDND